MLTIKDLKGIPKDILFVTAAVKADIVGLS